MVDEKINNSDDAVLEDFFESPYKYGFKTDIAVLILLLLFHLHYVQSFICKLQKYPTFSAFSNLV